VVAHRLATVQRADVIFVLGEGKVLEQGSHSELVGKRGVYWEMVCLVIFFCSDSQSDLGVWIERSLLIRGDF
jgi:hypothetical protein